MTYRDGLPASKQSPIQVVTVSIKAHNPLHTFPRNFPVDGEGASMLRTCGRADKSATSWQQVVVMEFGKRHDTTGHNGLLLPAPTCYGVVAGLLRGSYGETGVIDFGLDYVHESQRANHYYEM